MVSDSGRKSRERRLSVFKNVTAFLLFAVAGVNFFVGPYTMFFGLFFWISAGLQALAACMIIIETRFGWPVRAGWTVLVMSLVILSESFCALLVFEAESSLSFIGLTKLFGIGIGVAGIFAACLKE
jgi:hypothetical protein